MYRVIVFFEKKPGEIEEHLILEIFPSEKLAIEAGKEYARNFGPGYGETIHVHEISAKEESVKD